MMQKDGSLFNLEFYQVSEDSSTAAISHFTPVFHLIPTNLVLFSTLKSPDAYEWYHLNTTSYEGRFSHNIFGDKISVGKHILSHIIDER